MKEQSELIEAVIQAARDVKGQKRLACVESFRLAERFGVEKMEIGRVCNAHEIRISNCQLGCFE